MVKYELLDGWICNDTNTIHIITKYVQGYTLRYLLAVSQGLKFKAVKTWIHQILSQLKGIHE